MIIVVRLRHSWCKKPVALAFPDYYMGFRGKVARIEIEHIGKMDD